MVPDILGRALCQPGKRLTSWAWLVQARHCAVIEIHRFAASLETDLAAVRAAVTSIWSSGQVEGQINRLKYLKHQMFGRANFDLLREGSLQLRGPLPSRTWPGQPPGVTHSTPMSGASQAGLA